MPNSFQPHGLQHTVFLILHYLLAFAQKHVHWFSDAIQPSYFLLPPSPPALKGPLFVVSISTDCNSLLWVPACYLKKRPKSSASAQTLINDHQHPHSFCAPPKENIAQDSYSVSAGSCFWGRVSEVPKCSSAGLTYPEDSRCRIK